MAERSVSLSTLRSDGRPTPRKTRFRLPFQPGRTGLTPAGFRQKVYGMTPTSFSELAWRTGHSTFPLTETALAHKIMACQELRELLRAITAIMS